MQILTLSAAGELHRPILRNMFEARKRVFVDLLRWDVPVIDGRFELDQFDDEHATYLVVTDEAGRHLGSARLLETVRPHILGSLFPELCASAVPAHRSIREITRFCLDPDQGAAARRETRRRLVSGLVEHALSAEISAYTAVADMSWLQQILAFGWTCAPLGLPRPIGGRLVGALRIDISADTPEQLARNAMWAGSEPFIDSLRAA